MNQFSKKIIGDESASVLTKVEQARILRLDPTAS